jgi:hypothetical protein
MRVSELISSAERRMTWREFPAQTEQVREFILAPPAVKCMPQPMRAIGGTRLCEIC